MILHKDEPRPNAIILLTEAFQDESLYLLHAAAWTLQEGGHIAQTFIPAVIRHLIHPSEEVRVSAIYTLAMIGQGSPEAVQALIGALHDESSHVRFQAAKNLGVIGQHSPQAVAALTKAMKSEDASLRSAAICALSHLSDGSTASLSTLFAALRDSEAHNYETAIKAFARAAPQSNFATVALINVLNHPDTLAGYAAKTALIEAGQVSDAVLDAMIIGLRHEDWEVRRSLVEALGSLGPRAEKSVLALIDRLRDKNVNVAVWVPDALVSVGQRSHVIVPALMGIARTLPESAEVHSHAIDILARLGHGTRAVIRAQLAILHEETPRQQDAWFLRHSVVEALGRIGKGYPDVIAALVFMLAKDTNTHSVAAALAEVGEGSPEIARLLIDVLNGCSLETQAVNPMHPAFVSAVGRVGVPSPQEKTPVPISPRPSKSPQRNVIADIPDDAQSLQALLARIQAENATIAHWARAALSAARQPSPNDVSKRDSYTPASRLTETIREQIIRTRCAAVGALQMEGRDCSALPDKEIYSRTGSVYAAVIEAVYASNAQTPQALKVLQEDFSQYLWLFELARFESG